jgi:hypothetical protein
LAQVRWCLIALLVQSFFSDWLLPWWFVYKYAGVSFLCSWYRILNFTMTDYQIWTVI